ncbi:MAG: phosphotransferase [Kiritimatiellae bacterium]|nr:phosphotransferase [Kiritimatiellia bacterium]
MTLQYPKRAIVLAAGLGQRLQPLTWAFPKPVLPMWGMPMLHRIFALLQKWGVEEIAVNTHHLPEMVDRCVKDYVRASEGAVRIIVNHEPEILGTGGVLKPLRGFIGNEPFWLVNGDIVIEDLDAKAILEAFAKSGGFAGAWVSESFGPRTVEMDPEGRICNWHSDVAGDWGTYTYCGVAVLAPEITKYLPETAFSSIVDAYEKAMFEDGKFVTGAEVENSYWADCGTLERYLEAHAALDPERFEENPNVLFEGVKLADTADLAGVVATGGLVGGEWMRAALVGLVQLKCGEAGALCAAADALGWERDDVAVEFLGKRGSDRSFWRFANGDERAIAICYDDAARPENANYAACARLLAENGVAAVKVLADLPEKKVLVLEDCGDDSLEKRANKKGADLVKLYVPVMEKIKKFHEVRPDERLLQEPFDDALYAWERELFVREALQGRWGMDAIPEAVARELDCVAETLKAQRQVLLHRDAQSSNVLYGKDGAEVFIDFQGMRLGAAAYDVASFLYDPYVPLDERDRATLAGVYGIERKLLAYGAVQRLVQATGAFCRLAAAGQKHFEHHIPQALANLLAAADDADMDATGAFAEDLIARENMRGGGHHHHHHCGCGCEGGHRG